VCPPIELPPIPPTWQVPGIRSPGCKLYIELRDEAEMDQSEADGSYAAGLRDSCCWPAYQGLESLRQVLARDDGSTRTTAVLLAALSSLEFGDQASFDVLRQHVLENHAPDPFGARHIATSTLSLRIPGTGVLDNLMHVPAVIYRPLIALQVALAGSFVMLGQLREAAEALKTIIEPANDCPPKEPWGHPPPLAASGEQLPAGDDYADPLDCLDYMLCDIYRELDDPDAELDVIRQFPYSRLEVRKGEALERKGLQDSALLVYSDCISTADPRDPRESLIINPARYAKARLLIADGQLRAARDELAHLYADSPNFPDPDGLRLALGKPRPGGSRKAIPEEVRHAVWRRDEGRCTKCGSQEDLEFDHVIPVSRGGSDTERNLQLLCESCNRKKSATI
jgi:hypothetical protein